MALWRNGEDGAQRDRMLAEQIRKLSEQVAGLERMMREKHELHIETVNIYEPKLDQLAFTLEQLDIKELSGSLNLGNNFGVKSGEGAAGAGKQEQSVVGGQKSAVGGQQSAVGGQQSVASRQQGAASEQQNEAGGRQSAANGQQVVDKQYEVGRVERVKADEIGTMQTTTTGFRYKVSTNSVAHK